MKGHVQKADLYLYEHILRQKLELKLKVLKHSAFKKLGSRHSPYRPRVLLVQVRPRPAAAIPVENPYCICRLKRRGRLLQLARVLAETDEDRRHHIARLNELGHRVEKVRRPHVCVCAQMCIQRILTCTVVSQARPHKSVDTHRERRPPSACRRWRPNLRAHLTAVRLRAPGARALPRAGEHGLSRRRHDDGRHVTIQNQPQILRTSTGECTDRTCVLPSGGAVLDIAQQLHRLGSEQFKYDAVQGRTSWKTCNKLRTSATRARYAMAIYFSDMWESLDWINYLLFFGVLAIRIRNDSIVTDRLASIELLSTVDDPYADDNDHVPMYTLGFYYRVAMWLNAVNSMLTWLKIFKFLNYFPQLQILTSTMKFAALPLGWFLFVMFVVLMGLGQGESLRPAAATPMENPYRSCELTRGGGGQGLQLQPLWRVPAAAVS